MGEVGRGLLFGQTVDKIVHDDVGHPDVFAGAMVEMIAADREPVAVTTKKKDMQIGTSQADPGSQRYGTAVDEMGAVRVDEIGKAG